MSVLKNIDDVLKYSDCILKYADEHGKQFGFIPRQGYLDAIDNGKIWVVPNDIDDDIKGYLFWGGSKETLRVTQMFVNPKYRKQGIAKLLIRNLKAFGVDNNYVQIVAKVAEDLEDAQNFWNKVDFPAQRIVDGGKTTKRRIVQRVHTLPTSLLSNLEKEVFEFSMASKSFSNDIYVLDVNVLYDYVAERNYIEYIENILKYCLTSEKKIFLSNEFKEELNRTESEISKNPILKLAQNIPTLSSCSDDGLNAKLKDIIFPNFPVNEKKQANALSDIQHIADCIHNNIGFFITRDNALLKSSKTIFHNYGLSIVSPVDFISPNFDEEQFDVSALMKEDNLSNYIISKDCDYRSFLNIALLDQNKVNAFIFDQRAGAVSLGISDDLKNIVAVVSYMVEFNKVIINVLIKNDVDNCVVDMVLNKIFNICGSKGDVVVNPYGSQELISGLIKLGFMPNKDSSYKKVMLPCMINEHNWLDVVATIKQFTGTEISSNLPTYNNLCSVGVATNQNKALVISKKILDDFVYPSLILAKKQKSLIIPIRSEYESLLPIETKQLSMLGERDVKYCLERAYFRKPNNVKVFKPGMWIFFYVSGKDDGNVKYVAQISDSVELTVPGILKYYQRQGVLSEHRLESISKNGKVHMILFRGFKVLKNTMSNTELKNKGIGKNNFITAFEISYEQTLEIIK